MREDEHAIAVEKLMESFREETRFCMEDEDTWCHTTRSREYRRENIHLIRQKVEAIYFEFTDKVRKQVDALSLSTGEV